MGSVLPFVSFRIINHNLGTRILNLMEHQSINSIMRNTTLSYHKAQDVLKESACQLKHQETITSQLGMYKLSHNTTIHILDHTTSYS